MTHDDRPGSFDRVYTEFLLRRVVHDLSNSISGINSLSDYHLRSGVSDPALTESLTLIRESAESSRELLLAVGTLLQPPEDEEELVHVQTLIEETAKSLSLLVPRSVKLETTGNGQPDAVISVVRGGFVRKVLALAAMELVHVRVPSGSLKLAWTLEGSKAVRIQFRSSVRPDSKLVEQAPEFLADLSRRMDVVGVADGGASLVTMIFPNIEFEDGPE
jgi:hypothetical protein